MATAGSATATLTRASAAELAAWREDQVLAAMSEIEAAVRLDDRTGSPAVPGL